MREGGYYWVKYRGEFIIAECIETDLGYNWWYQFIDEETYVDKDFEFISDNRILPPTLTI